MNFRIFYLILRICSECQNKLVVFVVLLSSPLFAHTHSAVVSNHIL